MNELVQRLRVRWRETMPRDWLLIDAANKIERYELSLPAAGPAGDAAAVWREILQAADCVHLPKTDEPRWILTQAMAVRLSDALACHQQ